MLDLKRIIPSGFLEPSISEPYPELARIPGMKAPKKAILVSSENRRDQNL